MIRHQPRAAKRPAAHLACSKNSINYGSLGASSTGCVIHHLYDACGEGACDSSALSYTTTIASETPAVGRTLITHPQGSYNGWGERNVFFDAMFATAGQNEGSKDKTWMSGGGYGQSVLNSVLESRAGSLASSARFAREIVNGI